MKHTPGPWQVKRSHAGELEPFDAHGKHLLNSNGPLPLKVREANARLIAKAPEMKALLEEIVFMWDCNEPQNAMLEFQEKARNLLHKAKGETE